MEQTKSGASFILQIVKGVFTTVIVSLIAVLIFAGIIKIACLKAGVIKAVNQFIKVIAVFLGCFFSLRESNGILKGLLVGGLSALLITLIFALISSQVSFGLGLFIDIIFMSVIGAISGIITINTKT